MNTGVHESFQTGVFIFFRYIPSSGIAGSLGSSTCSFLRGLHAVFHSGCTSLHSHQQCSGIPVSPHPRQHLSFVVFMMTAVLTGVGWYVIVVAICVSLMINDAEHLFLCLLAIHYIFFGNMSVHVFCPCFELIGFLILSCMSCLYILDINPFSVIPFSNIFSIQ